MPEGKWGRFTARGGRDIEKLVTSLLSEIADVSRGLLPPTDCRAMVLLGGYGRGEGGVVKTDSGERPHNNLDFLVVACAMPTEAQARLKASLQEAWAPLKNRYGVELDLAIITESKLRRSPCLVMWYDMRFGHKTILGDPEFVPSLTQFSIERIPAWDVRNLLVNRGTLLTINDQLIASRGLLPKVRRLVVKHAMKAIIGYGDALLFFLGDYDWSYAEKQRRMRARDDVVPDFKDLYDRALEFRFQPSYAAFEQVDIPAWLESLRRSLAPIHLLCERKRLRCEGLDWRDYAEAAARHAIFEDAASLRAWGKKARNALRTGAHVPSASARASLGFRMLGPRGVLPLLFPIVGYHLEDERLRKVAASYLGARNTGIAEIRRAYLLGWRTFGDSNFPAFLDKWRIDLSKPVEAP